MIHRLRGELIDRDSDGAVIEACGVGYRVEAPLSTIGKLPKTGEECVLYIRMVVREDAMLLFGFATQQERKAFDALTSVTKIGPRLALAVLSVLSPDKLAEAISRADVVKLSTVPGLGRKTAERIVLELKDKESLFMGQEPTSLNGTGSASAYFEAREALVQLGYSLQEAEAALREVPDQDTTQGYLKEALRLIGSRR